MIRQTLRDLPVGLVQTYERILLKICKSPLRKQEIALRAFRWTLCARRPMKAEELQEAVAFEASDKSWDRDKIPDENLMIETCRGLLVRDEEERTVRFAHHTIQQYLLSGPVIRAQNESRLIVSPRSEAEALVGEMCVIYLCFSDFETQVTLRNPDVQFDSIGVLQAGGPFRIPTVLGFANSLLDIPYRLLGGKHNTAPINIDYSKYLTPKLQLRPQVPSTLIQKYRLLDYIVNFWIDHTKDLEPHVHARLQHLVMHKTLSFEFRPWGPNQHFGPYGCVSCPDPTKAKNLPFTGLFHYAARFGHRHLMESLAAEYCQHEVHSDETLLIACREGQDLIFQNLMCSFDYDISDGRAITVAVAAGHAEILKSLIVLSQNVATKSFYIIANATSLLNLAATHGHEKVVDMMWSIKDFENSIYINKKDERTGRTAFFSAVMNGNEYITRNLLTRGAKLKAHGNTAIHIAAEYGHQAVLQMLFYTLPRDPNGFHIQILLFLQFFDTEGDAPLHKAAKNGHSDAVRLILAHKPDVDLRSMHQETNENVNSNSELFGTGFTALHLAARGGHLEVVKLLIEGGAGIDEKTVHQEWTALYLAAAEGHDTVVQWLQRNGASTYARPKNGMDVLKFAVLRGQDSMVRNFLKQYLEGFGPYLDMLQTIVLIETASLNDKGNVLRTLLNYVGAFGEGPLQEALEVAEWGKYQRALESLKSLPGERLWEQDTEMQSWIATYRARN